MSEEKSGCEVCFEKEGKYQVVFTSKNGTMSYKMCKECSEEIIYDENYSKVIVLK